MVGVQDDGFPILCVNKSHTRNAFYKLVTLVIKKQCKIGFGSRAARTARRTWSCLSELLRRLEDEDAAVHGSTVVLFVLMLKEPTGHSDEVTSGGSRTGSSRLARSKG